MQDLLEHLHQQRRASEPAPIPPWYLRVRWDRLAATGVLVVAFLFGLGEIVARFDSERTIPPSPGDQLRFLEKVAQQVAGASSDSSICAAHPWLLWSWKIGTDLDGCPVLPGGYLGAAPSQPPIPGSLRVLVLGDHLATGSYRPWPVALARLARLSADGPRLDIMNASVPGYSSVQLERRWHLEKRVRPGMVILTEPEADTQPSLGAPDHGLGWSGVLGYLAVAGPGRLALGQKSLWPPSLESVRVPSKIRREVWLRMLKDMAKSNIPVLILTRPSRSVDGSFLDWAAILTAVQEQYPNATIDLLDLAEDFQRRDRLVLLTPDGQNLTPPGHNLISRLVMGRMMNLGVFGNREFEAAVAAAWYDSSSPDRPQVHMEVRPAHTNTTPGTTWTMTLQLSNTGNTRFLSRNMVAQVNGQQRMDLGGVRVIARHVTQGAPDLAPMKPAELSRDLLPGESTRWELQLTAPQRPGDYAIELALEAREVGFLEHFGCQVTTTTLSVR